MWERFDERNFSGDHLLNSDRRPTSSGNISSTFNMSDVLDLRSNLFKGGGDGAATTRQESTIVQSNQSGLNPNDLKLDDGNGSVWTLNGEEIEDNGLEHNMDQGDQIFLPTMHDEKSSQARMVVDLFQSEDGDTSPLQPKKRMPTRFKIHWSSQLGH